MMEAVVYLVGSFWLGAVHAATPGHGKTIAAAYIVGARGRPADAVRPGRVRHAVPHRRDRPGRGPGRAGDGLGGARPGRGLPGRHDGAPRGGDRAVDAPRPVGGALLPAPRPTTPRRRTPTGREHVAGHEPEREHPHHHTHDHASAFTATASAAAHTHDLDLVTPGPAELGDPARARRGRRASSPIPARWPSSSPRSRAARSSSASLTVLVFSLGFASVLVLVGIIAARVGRLVLTWLESRWILWLQLGTGLVILAVGILLTVNAGRALAALG